MHPTFLDKVIGEIISDNKTDYSDTTVVFPTRRAALIFRKKFAAAFSKPCFLPAAFSINDFIGGIYPKRIAERKELLLEFFPLYKKHFNHSTYKQYVPWGEMMLNDFNEIDRYLVNAQELFAGIKMSKEMDAAFGFDEEQETTIKKFWELFSETEPTVLKQKFLQTWDALPQLYFGFEEKLFAKNISTEGSAYREIAIAPKNFLSNTNTHLYFAGFYALTKAEELIFDYAQKTGGKLLWDADSYFVNDKMQEAGAFFRNNKFTQGNFLWKENCFSSASKKINICGAPLITAQIKHASVELEKKIEAKEIDINTTVFVLPDEKLLPSLLQSLPKTISALNVTMGFPFTETLLYRFLLQLTQLKKFSQHSNSTIFIHVKKLKELLAHPYAESFFKGEEYALTALKKIKGTMLPFSFLNLNEGSAAHHLLAGYNKNENIFLYFKQIITTVRIFLETEKDSIQHEIAGFILNELNELNQLVKKYESDLDSESVEMLISDLFETVRIPFSGEPVNGLQVMGFLETRALDFKNVIVLNLNEGTLPRISKHNSFIPFTLRKGFGLPTYEEQDAISAYHFWRLLYRAENVLLTYNTQVNDFAGGEKSRYLLQLFYEMQPQLNPFISVSHTVINTPLQSYTESNPGVKRTKELTLQITELFNANNQNHKTFSATSLHSFIHCSLQFYFSYIAKIKEPETNEEEIDAAMFGEIFHATMQMLYEPSKGKLFDKKLFDEIKSSIADKTKIAITEKFNKQYNETGQAYLIEKIITRYAEKIIEADEKQPGFTALLFEQPFFAKLDAGDNLMIELKGLVDRIDKLNDLTRIVDYKTGNDEVKDPKSIAEIFEKTDYKINLQLLLYAWLARKNNFTGKINAGIYPLRRIAAGMEMITEDFFITDAIINDFEKNLTALIHKIIFTSDFLQTNEIKKCEYCAYKAICNR